VLLDPDVGATVGEAVGDLVGDLVGVFVGDLVGVVVGVVVGVLVSDVVGDFVVIPAVFFAFLVSFLYVGAGVAFLDALAKKRVFPSAFLSSMMVALTENAMKAIARTAGLKYIMATNQF